MSYKSLKGFLKVDQLMLKKQKAIKKQEELTFWQSYSDMMAALLLVFVLIIAFYVSSLRKATEIYNLKIEELDVKNDKITEFQIILKAKEEELDKQNIAFKKQQMQLDKLIGIRSELIKKLKAAFDESSMGISVNTETGAISFDSKILFDFNSYVLKDSGIMFLNSFFPKYFEIILNDELSDYVAEIIIEGHTDNRGKYLYNLGLSQKRAFSVAEYCLNDENRMFEALTLDKIRKLVTANGRAFYDLKLCEDGEVDEAASRRVEIKFRLKEEEMIKEMVSILEKS